MLGEMIAEERGKTTVVRVLSDEGHGAKVEVSFKATGKLLGVEHTGIGTYWSVMRPDGTMYGEGQGLVITKNGDTATWVGQGAGKMTPGGGTSYRGAVYYQSASPGLSRLNGIATVFEYEVDANDNTSSKSWEWK